MKGNWDGEKSKGGETNLLKVDPGAPGNDDPLGLKSQTLSMIKSDKISESQLEQVI